MPPNGAYNDGGRPHSSRNHPWDVNRLPDGVDGPAYHIPFVAQILSLKTAIASRRIGDADWVLENHLVVDQHFHPNDQPPSP